MSSGTLNSIPKMEQTQVNILSQVWRCVGRILTASKASLIQDAVEVKWAIVKFVNQWQLTLTCLKSGTETVQKGVKCVGS